MFGKNYKYVIIKTDSAFGQLIEYYTSKEKACAEFKKSQEKMYWGGIDIQRVEICQIITKHEKGEEN